MTSALQGVRVFFHGGKRDLESVLSGWTGCMAGEMCGVKGRVERENTSVESKCVFGKDCLGGDRLQE